MKNLFDIRGRVVVVTGGAGILGRSICVYLAEQGARVAVLDRDEKAGEALVGEIRAAGGDALFFATDVLNREVADEILPVTDVEAIAIPALYRITYRTLVSDISQGG